MAPVTLSPSSLLAARPRLPSHVVMRAFVHETVVLNLATGRYHGLNTTGFKHAGVSPPLANLVFFVRSL
jgi:hypothetical protein